MLSAKRDFDSRKSGSVQPARVWQIFPFQRANFVSAERHQCNRPAIVRDEFDLERSSRFVKKNNCAYVASDEAMFRHRHRQCHTVELID